MNLLSSVISNLTYFKLISLLKCLGFVLLSVQISNAQSTIELLGTPGSGGPTNQGPTTSNQVVTFYSSTASAFSPTITATYSLSNQQFASIEGNPGVPGVTFGGRNTGAFDDPAGNIPTQSDVYRNLGQTSAPSLDWTSCSGCATGSINSTDNYGVELSTWADALLNSDGTSDYPLNSEEIYFADLTITFNQPVSNPVVSIDNLGGYYQYYTNATFADAIIYIHGYSTRLELMSPGSLSILSGRNIGLDGNQIYNTQTYYSITEAGEQLEGGVFRYTASGSVLVSGTNITQLVFRVMLDGDPGEVRNWSFDTPAVPTLGNQLQWSSQFAHAPNGIASLLYTAQGDQYKMSLSFKEPVMISGNVFYDPDGGNVNNSSGAMNTVPSGMFANLLDENGNVIMSVPVNTDGTYSFPAAFESSASGYSVVLSATMGVQGNPAPSPDLPTGWVNTGEHNGTPDSGNDGDENGLSQSFVVGTTDVININFGIEQPPVANNVSEPEAVNPGGTNQVQVPTLDYSDPEDGTPAIITIETLPDPNTEGLLYYNGVLVTVGQEIINYDPTLLTVDPVDGLVTVDFTYSTTDAAGETSPPATATLIFTSILPIELISFNALQNNNDVNLSWMTLSEKNNDHFVLEYSKNGTDFNKIADVKGAGNSNFTQEYGYVHKDIALERSPMAYYRLMQVDFDGKASYTPIRHVELDKNESQKFAYSPNPVEDQLSITGAVVNDEYQLQIRDVTGKIVFSRTYTSGMIVNIGDLYAGIYLVIILDHQSQIIDSQKVIKQ